MPRPQPRLPMMTVRWTAFGRVEAHRSQNGLGVSRGAEGLIQSFSALGTEWMIRRYTRNLNPASPDPVPNAAGTEMGVNQRTPLPANRKCDPRDVRAA